MMNYLFYATVLAIPVAFTSVLCALLWSYIRHCNRTVEWCKQTEGYDR